MIVTWIVPRGHLYYIGLHHNLNMESLSPQFILLNLVIVDSDGGLLSLQLPLTSRPPLSMSNPDEQMGGGGIKGGKASLLPCYNIVSQLLSPLTSCPLFHHALFSCLSAVQPDLLQSSSLLFYLSFHSDNNSNGVDLLALLIGLTVRLSVWPSIRTTTTRYPWKSGTTV